MKKSFLFVMSIIFLMAVGGCNNEDSSVSQESAPQQQQQDTSESDKTNTTPINQTVIGKHLFEVKIKQRYDSQTSQYILEEYIDNKTDYKILTNSGVESYQNNQFSYSSTNYYIGDTVYILKGSSSKYYILSSEDVLYESVSISVSNSAIYYKHTHYVTEKYATENNIPFNN